jgi:hypothetical protein
MDTFERTHVNFPAVFVFKIPPRTTTAGYKAADWPKEHIWTGRLRVVSKGAQTSVLLEHTDGKEGLFANCVIDSDQAYEQVVDSSRYFALRISDGKGRHAVIGLGFNDRAQAFEFKVALQDARKLTVKDETSKETKDLDFSLPQGGMLHIDLKKKKEKDKLEQDDFLDFASGPASPNDTQSSPPKKKDPEKKKKKKKDDLDGFASLSVSGGTPTGWVSF